VRKLTDSRGLISCRAAFIYLNKQLKKIEIEHLDSIFTKSIFVLNTLLSFFLLLDS